jgi:cell division protein FtsB
LIAASSVVLAYLLYAFFLSDTGAFKILSLRRESDRLRRQKIDLAIQASELDRRRSEEAHDPLLEERIARERFHLVKKGEIVYRYAEPPDTGR